MKTIAGSILLCFISWALYAQGIRDSLFTIDQVEIKETRDFSKETAGLMEIKVDSFLIVKHYGSSLSDLLSEHTGIQIKNYGRGALATTAFRGTAPSHTKVTWNGIDINSPMLGMVDFSLIPVFIIDELNVQYGAASLASRSGGLGGLIELRNQPDWKNRRSVKIYQEIGSFRTGSIFSQYDVGNEYIQSRTRLYYNSSENNYSYINKNILEKDSLTGALYHPEQENLNAEYRKYGFNQEFYIRPRSQIFFSNNTWYQDSERAIPTVLSSEYDETRLIRQNNQTDHTVKNVSELQYYWSRGSATLRSGIDWQTLDYSFIQQISGLDPRITINSHSTMLSWINVLHLKYDVSEKLSVKLFGGYNQYAISTLDSVIQSGYDATRKEFSLFGSAAYAPVEKLQLTVQLRKDFIQFETPPLMYVAGVSVKPFPSGNLVFKGNFSRNYHLPSLNDLYWQPGGNPYLNSEEGYSEELSVVYSFITKRLYIHAFLSGYLSNINNWILWLPGIKGYWEPMNIDRVRSTGSEFQLDVSYQNKGYLLRGKSNISYNSTIEISNTTQASDQGLSSQLPFVPKFAGNLFLSVQKLGYLLSWQHSTTGARSLLTSNISGLDDDSGELFNEPALDRMQIIYPHYLNKLSVGKEFRLAFGVITAELRIDNLFNETYRNILNRFMPGRSYMLSLKLDLNRELK
ncbi:TonB-dependent receptor plug domain-containing protein [Bacteroidota bacterium]